MDYNRLSNMFQYLSLYIYITFICHFHCSICETATQNQMIQLIIFSV